ncbi:MAG: metal ABC transporter substrate-binding protein [Geodermatophilaceae bacterium]
MASGGTRLLALVALSTVLGGCGADTEGSGAADGRLDVQASFYPLQWIAERVGGDAVAVSSLTPPGAEPHDLELSAQDVGAISQADLVVYLSGFQAAVDEAVLREAEVSAFDAAEHTDLSLTYNPIEEGEQSSDGGDADVHFWLDPLRLADVSDALAERLGEVDSDNAATFTENAQTLRAELERLDTELREGLADCANSLLVTSHNAFGYLAEAYGLTQIGITGLTPEEEPSAASLANIASFIEANDVRTIYVETLVSPEIAETIALEAGVDTALLDPIEGLTEESDGEDYLEVMRSNLATLRAGQPCS